MEIIWALYFWLQSLIFFICTRLSKRLVAECWDISAPNCTFDTFKRGAGILRAVQASLATRNTFVYHIKFIKVNFEMCPLPSQNETTWNILFISTFHNTLHIKHFNHFVNDHNDKQLKDSRSVFLIKLNKFIGPCFFSISSRGSVAIERSDRFCESVKGK